MSQNIAPSPRKRPWPDMSAYGIHFGVLDMPNGEPRMVMVDRDGAWRELARRMGFSQSRWFGLYVKSSLKLDIPGFGTNFPLASVLQLTDQEIRDRVRPLILERRDQRLSQMAAGKGRLSWHPTKTLVAEAVNQVAGNSVDESDGDASDTLSPAAALRQTLFLGLNAQGQEVYESGDGQRFAKSGVSIIAREAGEVSSGPMFLRATTNEELVQVAAGMVKEIQGGRRLHSDDFIRYVEAVSGPNSTEDKSVVSRFHAAVDAAMLERVSSVEGAGQDAFEAALQLHEGRPPFWRESGTWTTPLPIAVVMQSLASASALSSESGELPKVIDISSAPGSHSWSFGAESVSQSSIPEHDIALGAVFGEALDPQSLGGVRVTRTDSEALLSAIGKRNPDGLTVFLLSTEKAGKLDNEFRRVISALGQRFEIAGLVDIAPSLIGPGATDGSRMVVVGRKRSEPDYAFSVGADIPVLFDYGSLWSWAESLRASQMGEVHTFGDDGREENRWQAPYIASSQVSEPETMSPRNLLGPVRMALAHIVDSNGLGIDEFVCSKLGWTMEQLEQRLSSEQTDAVAIGIQSIDDGMGMVEADATGLGKGRVAATLAVYAKKIGMPVVFMTEKADLFSDFYRDVQDINCMDELGNPFIVNNELIVRDTATQKEIARSPKRDAAQMTMACGDFPADHDIVLATYSQFNRKYESGSAFRNSILARCIRDLLKTDADVFAALSKAGSQLGLGDYASNGVTTLDGAVAYEKSASLAFRARGESDLADQADRNAALLQLSKDDMLKDLSERIKSDMTTLKHQWLYSGAFNGALLILDESHVAAGEKSQTGTNLRFLVENAGAVAYSSATFAKDIGNFILYSRLFPSNLRASTIGETLTRGGEAMQEIVSGMLAKDGRLIRREHDLSNLEFKVTVDKDRKERNEYWANGFAQVLAAMSYVSGEVEEIAISMNEELEKSLKAAKKSKSGPNGSSNAPAVPTVGVQYTNFSSKFYNLSRAFMMAVNADQSADLAINALKEGRKPVITVENTMETVLKELIDGVELDHELLSEAIRAAGDQSSLAAADPLANVGNEPGLFDGLAEQGDEKKGRSKLPEVIELGRTVSFKDILHKYVDSMFKASKQTRKGNRLISSTPMNLMTPELEDSVAQLKMMIDAMPDVPLSPIDLVRDRISEAGYTVDEISGRRMRLQVNADGTHRVVRMSERKKLPLKNAFNNGSLDALILSKSGSTGISLHASRTFGDQSQRELIELQPASDIAQRLQFWGRVNRKGQVCWPVIHMVSSGLPAENRLITMQNAKLRKMSANISGNADNSALNEDVPDILNKIGNEVCYRWMESNPQVSRIIGYRVGEIPEDQAKFGNTKFVDMLTGRLLMLDVDTQTRVYREITAEFKALIEQYELEGVNPLKSAEYDLRAQKTGSAVLQVAGGYDSVFNEAVTVTELTYPIQLPGLNKDEVLAAIEIGRAALVEKFGKDFAKVVVANSDRALTPALHGMLPKRFATIEQAMMDDKPNAVRNAANKFAWLSKRLPKCTPGSVLTFTDPGNAEALGTGNDDDARHDISDYVFGYGDGIFITGWKVPETNFLSMAEYKLTGYSLKSRKKIEISLSSLYTRTCMTTINAAKDTIKSIESDYERIFESLSQPVVGSEKRIILEGNLYRAAEIAETQKQGTAVTYSDERGIWHHAILMPKSQTLKTIHELPVSVDTAETLIAAFASKTEQGEYLEVCDDHRLKSDTRQYSIHGRTGHVYINVYASAEKGAWILNNAEIKSCLKNADFEGSRGSRGARVLPGLEEKFFSEFMRAANDSSAQVSMSGGMREWYNDYLTKKLDAKVDQKTVDAAMSNNDEEELGALLAMH
ncbi:strawberry notch C-terminal domain-containing protein [Paucibacter soli]|uniref:strawberry notch C-terminal domain-containing protein n=1 Tax=Paucibacter soli TaxID=3133433 RepID=UPI0030A286FE